MAILAEDFLLGISTMLPFQVGCLQRKMVFIVVNLVAAGAKVGTQMKRGFNAFMEPSAAVL
jgi:hypothetical protein